MASNLPGTARIPENMRVMFMTMNDQEYNNYIVNILVDMNDNPDFFTMRESIYRYGFCSGTRYINAPGPEIDIEQCFSKLSKLQPHEVYVWQLTCLMVAIIPPSNHNTYIALLHNKLKVYHDYIDSLYKELETRADNNLVISRNYILRFIRWKGVSLYGMTLDEIIDDYPLCDLRRRF